MQANIFNFKQYSTLPENHAKQKIYEVLSIQFFPLSKIFSLTLHLLGLHKIYNFFI